MESIGDSTVKALPVEVSDGQYRIEDPQQTLEDPWPDPVDRLTTGEDGWFAVLTGVEWGPLTVTFDLGAGPLAEDLSVWEAVVQRSIHMTGDRMHVSNSGSQLQHVLQLQPGWYTVQVHARGRMSRFGKGHDPAGQEEHLIQLRRSDDAVANRILVGPDEFGML